MFRALQIYLFFQALTAIAGECILEESTSERDYATITCTNTSTEDYVYEVLELFSSSFMHSPSSRAAFALRIRNLNFSATTSLVNPRLPTNITDQSSYARFIILSLNFCGLKSVEEDIFINFPELRELDLGFNEIDDSSFVSYLPQGLSILNLTRNRIEYVNFTLFEQYLGTLDLSFNKILYLDTSSSLWRFPVLKYLALNNNNISEIILDCRGTEDLDLNLAYNNLKLFKNSDNNRADITFKSINLDHSIMDVNILKDVIFSVTKLVLVNNELQALEANLSCSSCRHIDLSNCSLSRIHYTIFRNSYIESLNLSHNNLELLNSSLFGRSRIETLDLSYNKIETIKEVFQDAIIHYLNLSHNKISELYPTSFRNLENLQWLDLSFNNLKLLENDCFVNSYQLSFLNLASNKLANIADQAFNGLSVSGILNLDNNLLKNLSTNVFKPLTMNISLRNNQIKTIQSHLFDSIPVSSIILSENRIESIQSKAFHNLTGLGSIYIDNNCCHMTIESGAFSELPQVDLISLKNSKIDNISSEIFVNVSSLNMFDIRNNDIISMNFSSHNSSVNINEIQLTLKGDIKPKTFSTLMSLQYLSFWNSDITNVANKAFQGLFYLRTLSLINTTIGHLEKDCLNGLFSITSFSDKSFFSGQKATKSFIFKDFDNLENLNLSNIGLEEIMPFSFSGMKKLETLYLDHNQIKLLQKSAFSGLGLLKLLDLSYNELTILKHDDFLGLSGLLSLSISNNNINDMELGSLQNFPQLEHLSIANNNLTELRVGAFSNLYHLKQLDISQNRISSLLFESFIPLKSLEYLNLEFNNLKTIQHTSLVYTLKYLKRIRIAHNKWKCEFLVEILVTFRKRNIDYSSDHLTFFDDNIEGIHCIDVCKYLFCLQDSHGIN